MNWEDINIGDMVMVEGFQLPHKVMLKIIGNEGPFVIIDQIYAKQKETVDQLLELIKLGAWVKCEAVKAKVKMVEI